MEMIVYNLKVSDFCSHPMCTDYWKMYSLNGNKVCLYVYVGVFVFVDF